MENIIKWLLCGDGAIQYQARRDLLDSNKQELTNLQKNISKKGWGKAFLDKRDAKTKLWGNGYYSPKWIFN